MATLTDEQIRDAWIDFHRDGREVDPIGFGRILLASSADHSNCCITPAFCSSVRRRTAKDAAAPAQSEPVAVMGSVFAVPNRDLPRGTLLYAAPPAQAAVTPAQWCDIYYFARAVEIDEFIRRAQAVFDATQPATGAKS